MAGSSISGLISGMDIDALVNAQLQSNRVPMEKIEKKMGYSLKRKDVINDSIDKMQDFKNVLLDLKLESTFKQKEFNSGNENIVRGDASLNAVKGSYTVNVDNIAVPAVASSSHARASLLNSPPNTANISSVSGRPAESFEGEAELEISSSASGYKATASYSKNGGGRIGTYSGSVIESSTQEGTIDSTLSTAGGSNELQMTVNGESFSVYLDFALQDTDSLKTVASDMEKKINDKLNEINDTSNHMYVMVNAESIEGGGNEFLKISNLEGSFSSDITFDGGGAVSVLGLDSVDFSAETEITDSWTAASLADLRTELNSENTGFLPGVTIGVPSGETLTTGSATFHINSRLRTLGAVSPSIQGGENITESGSLYLSQPLLSVDFAYDDLTYAEDNSATFTINDTEITIPDVTEATVKDVLSMINSSSAEVTASYDSSGDRFILSGNEDSVRTSISLGSAADTTNFLQVSRLSLAHGGTLYPGSSKSFVDKKEVLSDAGLSGTPMSGTFTINGTSLYVDVDNDSLEDLISKINNSNAGVIAAYDQNADKFYLRSDPESVLTNAKKIETGSSQDTSNILEVLNISSPYTSVSGSAVSGNRDIDSVIFQKGSLIDETVAIPSVTGSGAYNAEAYETAWTDGIDAGDTFSIEVTDGGGTPLADSPFTWTAPEQITNLDDFLEAWNDSANWTDSGGVSSNVQVGAVKDGDDSFRFFSLETGAGNSFTVTEGTAGDAAELGFTSGDTVSEGAGGTATALYNALNFSRSMMLNENVRNSVDISVDSSAEIDITSLQKGTEGMFILSDDATYPPTTVDDYFGDIVLRSDSGESVGRSGEDSRFSVDGVVYERTGNKISDVIGGVDLQLVSESDSNVTIDIDGNTEPALDALVDFIFNYNKIRSDFEVEVLSKEDREYLDPLTPDMLDDFSTTSEVDEYEMKHNEVIRKKIMREENAHRSFRDFARGTVNMPVEQSGIMFSTLGELGIRAGSMGSYEDQKEGYLLRRFDPEKETEEEYKEDIRKELENNYDFMNRLRDNADDVHELFSAKAEEGESVNASGLAVRIQDRIDSYILTGGLLKEKVKNNGQIDRNLRMLQEQYENYENRLELREKTLYNKYNAMEEMMARLQQQSQSLLQAMGSSEQSTGGSNSEL